MNQFKAKIRIKKTATSQVTVETIVTAKTFSDAKAIIQGQYGSSLLSIYGISEVR
jgi:hypothetical protein